MDYAVEILSELLMQALLGYLVYVFLKGYSSSKNRGLLVLGIFFAVLFLFHLIFPLYLEDIAGYEFQDPWEPHHIILLGTLLALSYVVHGAAYRGGLQRRPAGLKKSEERKSA